MTMDPLLTSRAESGGLGPAVSLHRGPKDMLYVMGGSVLLGLALLSFILWKDAVPENQRQEALEYILPGAGALFVLIGIVGFFRLKGRALQFHQNGLVYKEGSSVRVLRFADVVGLDLDLTQTNSNTGTSYSGTFSVLQRDGSSMAIQPNLENIDSVVDKLTDSVAEPIVSAVTNELRQGRSVPSGAFNLTVAGIEHKGQTIAWTSVSDVSENSEMGTLTFNTKAWLEVRGKGGEKFRVHAGKVRNRSFLNAIADEMKPQAKASHVSMSFETIQAQDELDPVVGKAVRPLMTPQWRSATLMAEARDDGEIASLSVFDPTTGQVAQPSPELIEAVRRVFALHQKRRTGVDRYTLTLSPSSDGKWSISSAMASKYD